MIQVSDTNLLTLQYMVNDNLLPKEGNFEVTEDLLFAHRQIYATFGSGSVARPSSYRNARRYAGAGFLYVKKFRKIPAKEINEGFLYLISNPAWPEQLKVGISVDLKKRLSSYQTYSPLRDFVLDSYEFVLNKREYEKDIINRYSTDIDLGEWISKATAKHIIEELRNSIDWRQDEYLLKDRNSNRITLGCKVKFKPSKSKPLQYGIVKAFKANKTIEIESFVNGTKYYIPTNEVQII